MYRFKHFLMILEANIEKRATFLKSRYPIVPDHVIDHVANQAPTHAEWAIRQLAKSNDHSDQHIARHINAVNTFEKISKHRNIEGGKDINTRKSIEDLENMKVAIPPHPGITEVHNKNGYTVHTLDTAEGSSSLRGKTSDGKNLPKGTFHSVPNSWCVTHSGSTMFDSYRGITKENPTGSHKLLLIGHPDGSHILYGTKNKEVKNENNRSINRDEYIDNHFNNLKSVPALYNPKNNAFLGKIIKTPEQIAAERAKFADIEASKRDKKQKMAAIKAGSEFADQHINDPVHAVRKKIAQLYPEHAMTLRNDSNVSVRKAAVVHHDVAVEQARHESHTEVINHIVEHHPDSRNVAQSLKLNPHVNIPIEPGTPPLMSTMGIRHVVRHDKNFAAENIHHPNDGVREAIAYHHPSLHNDLIKGLTTHPLEKAFSEHRGEQRVLSTIIRNTKDPSLYDQFQNHPNSHVRATVAAMSPTHAAKMIESNDPVIINKIYEHHPNLHNKLFDHLDKTSFAASDNGGLSASMSASLISDRLHKPEVFDKYVSHTPPPGMTLKHHKYMLSSLMYNKWHDHKSGRNRQLNNRVFDKLSTHPDKEISSEAKMYLRQ